MKSITLHPFEVKAALDGRLMQVRRPTHLCTYDHIVKPEDITHKGGGVFRVACFKGVTHISSPLFVPGNTLWARETWAIHRILHYDEGVEADEWSGPLPKSGTDRACISYKTDNCDGPWRSPVTMPRWASRITLTVKVVRVERPQDITREDIRKMGISLPPTPKYRPSDTMSELHQEFVYEYWNPIYQKRGYSWGSNPWVWVADVTAEVK